MLLGMLTVIQNDDLKLAEDLRKLDDTVDELYSAIKYYLTKISREALGEEESRRWTDIISFTINMEQIGDIIERVLIDIEDKKIKPGRNFSEAGMAEISELHDRLMDNLRLGMSVFLNGNVRDAQKLLEEKARFRDLERAYAATHLGRLSANTRAEHGNQFAAHRPDQRPQAHQLAHLLDRLPDPGSAGALAPNRLRSRAGRTWAATALCASGRTAVCAWRAGSTLTASGWCSRWSCALPARGAPAATSASAKRWSMRIFTLPLATIVEQVIGHGLRGFARGDVGEQRLARHVERALGRPGCRAQTAPPGRRHCQSWPSGRTGAGSRANLSKVSLPTES